MTTNARNPTSTAGRTAVGTILTATIIGLTIATAYIHLTLGGVLFTLNGLGYLGLAVLFVIGAVAPIPLVDRFSWLARVSLAGYAALTIGAYLVMGPHFSLGWIAKAIELGIMGLVAVDVYRVYGGPVGLVRSALESVGLGRRLA
jgi:hypothetical protein